MSTLRPLTVPCPVITPSPSGRRCSIPKAWLRCRSASSSSKESSSSSSVMRSRAVSLPHRCCLSTAIWKEGRVASCCWRRNSSMRWAVVLGHRRPHSVVSRGIEHRPEVSRERHRYGVDMVGQIEVRPGSAGPPPAPWSPAATSEGPGARSRGPPCLRTPTSAGRVVARSGIGGSPPRRSRRAASAERDAARPVRRRCPAVFPRGPLTALRNSSFDMPGVTAAWESDTR